MNKFKSLVIMSLMLFVGGQMMGQTRGALFLGASFPMGDFAKYSDFNNFALINANVTEAGAAIGFNAGLKWYFNPGVKGLNVMLSVDGFYNGPSPDLKTAYRNNEGSSAIFGDLIGDSFSYKATPKFINVPAMLGLNYKYHINPQLAVYAEAGAGGNCRFITKKESVAEGHISAFSETIHDTQNYDKAFSFAYQAGIGFEVAKSFVVGCSFYDLGAAEVKGEQIIKTNVNGNISTNERYNTFGTVHPIMVLARIGFSF